MPGSQAFEANSGPVTLSGESAGTGPAIVLLHGLTATRRYVVMGSRLLERGGLRVVAYDARGHGESSPAPDSGAYAYPDLAADLGAVLDHHALDRAVLAGSSMGAHTAAAFALAHPERVAGLVAVTPASAGLPPDDLAEWDALADGLEREGVDGFLAAWQPQVGERWQDTVYTVARQRLERHRHLPAVADALRAVPRSTPFDGLDALAAIEVPALVVGSRDDADPGHPLPVAQAWAEHLPDAELAVEEPGASPLAWQGAQLSRAILEFLERRGLDG